MCTVKKSMNDFHSRDQWPYRFHETKGFICAEIKFPKDCFGPPAWSPFLCFGPPILPPSRHVKTISCVRFWTDISFDYYLLLGMN